MGWYLNSGESIIVVACTYCVCALGVSQLGIRVSSVYNEIYLAQHSAQLQAVLPQRVSKYCALPFCVGDM